MDWVLYSFLLAIDRQVFAMKASGAIALVTLLVGLIVIPQSGFVSLPYIQIGVEFSLFVVQLSYLKKIEYTIFSVSYLLKPTIASIVMGIVLVVLGKLTLFVIIPIGAALYLLTLYTIKGFGEQEVELIKGTLLRLSAGKSRDRD